jgi:hypothetical protein
MTNHPRLVGSLTLLTVLLLVACDDKERLTHDQPTATPTRQIALEGTTPDGHNSWIKPRYVSVGRAIARLRAHIDTPIVLPRDASAGLPGYRRWKADPKYLESNDVDGTESGTLNLIKKKRMLGIDFGTASFDGCGGRDHAIRTDVRGQPALLSVSRESLWSHIIWPVRSEGSTGRYGLYGTFEGWQLIRLAESMERGRLEAIDAPEGCT